MTDSMTTQPEAGKVIIGVDTHKHVHVAVAIDTRGMRLGAHSFGADSGGYRALLAWALTHGRIEAFGVEGTGSYGAALARAVRRAGHRVAEVNRGDRRLRRAAGKSDTIDAEAAARSVLAGQATAIPKTADGAVEMLRQLKVARDTAVKARTSAMITLKQILVTAPPALRETLQPLTDHALLTRCAGLRPGALDTPDRVGQARPPGARPSLDYPCRGDRGARPAPGASHNRHVAHPPRRLRCRCRHRGRVTHPLRR